MPTLNYSSSANFSIKRNYSTTAAGGVAVLIPPQLKTSNSYSLAENVNDPSTNAPMISAPENSDFYQELLLKYNNNNNNSVNINWKQFPNDQYNYNDYVSQIQLSCQQKLHDGVFDVVWMNATTAGFLSDCLVDLWEYDADITAGHDPTIAWNGVVKQRLGKIKIRWRDCF